VGVFSKNLSNDLATIKADIEYMKNAYAIGENPIFKNAPALIFITAPKKDIQAKDDCIIAQQYMMLYAESLGIGSCINGYAQFANKKIAKLLAIKSSHAIFSAGIFGYSKYTYKNEIIYNNNSEIFWM
jgi:nitroreductase